MRTLIFSFIFIGFSIAAYAQIVIKGKVLNNKSNLPVVNASVYFNNTSIGTVTNNNGEFILITGSIYTGELIISSVGYQPLSYPVNNRDADKSTYTFKLDIKESVLKDILIINHATRMEWLKMFKENFLGVTEEGNSCRIENLNDIYFIAGKNKNIIYAYADTPLVITNSLLGYQISFDLIEFSYDKENRQTYFTGYNRYTEMGDKKRWIKRRKQNYFGSTMHFYRSLVNKSLEVEGYTIFEITKLPQNTDSATVIPPSHIQAINFSVASPIAASQILFIDTITNNYFIACPNQIMVQYNKIPHSTYYLTQKGFFAGVEHFGFTAFINLLSDKVELNTQGIISNPLQVMYTGFWMYEKMGNQLPFNYNSE